MSQKSVVCKECAKFLTGSLRRQTGAIACFDCGSKVHDTDKCRRNLRDGNSYCLSCSNTAASRLQMEDRQRLQDQMIDKSPCIKCGVFLEGLDNPLIECENKHREMGLHFQHYQCIVIEAKRKEMPPAPDDKVFEDYSFNCDTCVQQANLCQLESCQQDHAACLSKLIECPIQECRAVYHYDCINLSEQQSIESKWPCPNCLDRDSDSDIERADASESSDDSKSSISSNSACTQAEPAAQDEPEYNPDTGEGVTPSNKSRRRSKVGRRNIPTIAVGGRTRQQREFRTRLEKAQELHMKMKSCVRISLIPSLEHFEMPSYTTHETPKWHLVGNEAEQLIIE